jgi:hypothetical protein
LIFSYIGPRIFYSFTLPPQPQRLCLAEDMDLQRQPFDFWTFALNLACPFGMMLGVWTKMVSN